MFPFVPGGCGPAAPHLDLEPPDRDDVLLLLGVGEADDDRDHDALHRGGETGQQGRHDALRQAAGGGRAKHVVREVRYAAKQGFVSF